MVFFFKQNTAYEVRISDWSSDVCASDLLLQPAAGHIERRGRLAMSDENLALDMDKPLHRALDFWAGIDGSDSKAVGEALSALSLSHLADVPVRMLSTGQRKRAMLARVVDRKSTRLNSSH